MPTLEISNLSSAEHLVDPTLRNLCVETVSLGLEEFDRIRHREANDTPLILAIFDHEDRIVGGLLGKLLRGWLRIDMIWVAADLRGLGYGKKLVQRAEEIGLADGCTAAHLDTYSYQSPGFYLRLGYEVFGELHDYPVGETKYYLKKSLVPSDTG